MNLPAQPGGRLLRNDLPGFGPEQFVTHFRGAPFEIFQDAESMLLFVVLLALVDVVLTVSEHPIDESGQFVGCRGDGFRSPQAHSHPSIVSPQGTLAAVQALRGNPQGLGGPVNDLASRSSTDFAPRDPVVRA